MKRGFTLTEILITIVLIGILVALVLYFIQPFEIGKRHRDLQRIKDLEALSLAINSYLATANKPDLDGPFYDLTGQEEDNSSIFISVPIDLSTFSTSTIIDYYGKKWSIIQHSSTTNLYSNNGEGWLPINFNEGNVILPTLPVDPINTINPNYSNKNYFYSYVFRRQTNEFEINAKFESNLFQRRSKEDNGSDEEIYEVGNNKCLIAFGTSSSIFYGTTTITRCFVNKLESGLRIGNIIGSDLCWNKLFDYYPTRNYVYRNNSGDYLIIGNNIIYPTTSIFISIFDKFGNFRLSKIISFNTTAPMNFNYIHQTKNSDYLLGLSLNGEIKASVVLKLDKNLNVKWLNYYCYSPTCSAREESIYLVDDINDNINLIRNVGSHSGFQMIKISSSSGDILSGNDFKYSIIFGRLYAGNKTIDGGFVLLGTYGLATSPPVFLAKFDSQNNFEWIKHYLRLGMSERYSMTSPRSIFVFQTNDGGYFFNAMYDIDIKATSYIFVKTDYLGRLEWLKKYNGDWSKISIRKIFQDKQNYFWLVINSSSENYLLKLDSNFNKINEYKITSSYYNNDLVFNNFFQLFDNSYLLVGNFVDRLIAYYPLRLFKKTLADGLDLGVGTYTAPSTNPEELAGPPPLIKPKLYFNTIKFISDKDLFYLKNNIYNITSTNLFSFSDISSTITKINIGTSTYSVDKFSLGFTEKLIQVKQITLVNQCDNYFSKNVGKRKIIENLIRTNDGYLVVGKDITNIPQSSFWIAKFNSEGRTVASSSFKIDDNYAHQLTSVIQDGNNFVAVGKYYQEGEPSLSLGYIAKFNNSLSFINSSSLTFYSELNDIKRDSYYYVLVGKDLTFAEPKALFLKINSSSLDIITSSTYGYKSEFNSLLIDENENYIAGGQIDNQTYLVKINSTTLGIIWQKSYYLKIGKEKIVKLIFDQDGNIVSLSNLFDSQDNKFKLVLRKINPDNGEIIKEKLISENYFYGRDIILDYYNDFLITGSLPLSQDGENFTDWTLGLIKVTKDFNLVWQKYYGEQSRKDLSFGASIVNAYNAGYLIGGYNAAGDYAWLIKVSYLGDCLGCIERKLEAGIFVWFKSLFANFLNLILR